MTRSELIGYIQFYERLLADLQGRIFYAEDDEGVLRRWSPPRPLNLDTKEGQK